MSNFNVVVKLDGVEIVVGKIVTWERMKTEQGVFADIKIDESAKCRASIQNNDYNDQGSFENACISLIKNLNAEIPKPATVHLVKDDVAVKTWNVEYASYHIGQFNDGVQEQLMVGLVLNHE